MNLNELLNHFQNQHKALENHYLVAKGQQDSLIAQEKHLKDEQTQCKIEYEELLQKREILEQASTKAREEGKALFVNVVTNSLQMVFSQKASADIVLGKKSGLATADVVLCLDRNGKMVQTDPTSEDSGGMADMISLGIFMSNSLLGGKNNTAGFFLDEPTKFVSAAHAEAAANFIKEMVQYTGKQTFLTTHERNYLPFVANRSHLVSINEEDGVSTVEKYAEEGTLLASK